MTCGTCGATIADKAIICYRCGAPTTWPAPRTSQPTRARTPWIAVAVSGAAALVLGAVGVSLPFESPEQIASLAGAAAALLTGGALWLRRRR